jgi:hypoxanthine-DNA glycosylase
MGDIYGAGWSIPYVERVQILKERGIAVWDVVQACTRTGSLDSGIKNEIVNDFEGFYKQTLSIKLVVFDSAAAEKI